MVKMDALRNLFYCKILWTPYIDPKHISLAKFGPVAYLGGLLRFLEIFRGSKSNVTGKLSMVPGPQIPGPVFIVSRVNSPNALWNTDFCKPQMMWFDQTSLNINQFETSLSVNGGM